MSIFDITPLMAFGFLAVVIFSAGALLYGAAHAAIAFCNWLTR